MLTIIREGDERQLVLFPYAGGMANSFSNLLKKIDLLPDNTRVIRLNYPGHDVNQGELLNNIYDFEKYFQPVIESLLTRPTWFFGYSLGGQLVYKFKQKFSSLKMMRGIVIAASPAPSEIKKIKGSRYPGVDAAIEKLVSKIGLPEKYTDQSLLKKELIDYYSPIFKADSQLFHSCGLDNIQVGLKFNSADILFGERDQSITTTDILSWINYFDATVFHSFPGGHMSMVSEEYSERTMLIISNAMKKD